MNLDRYYAGFKGIHKRGMRFYIPGPTVSSTAPRNITQEMLQTISGYEQTTPRQFALQQQFDPLHGQLDLELLRQSMMGFDKNGQHQPGTLELGRTATEYNRAGDLADVIKYGPESTEGLLNANQYLRHALDNLDTRVADSPLLRTLNAQAMEGLLSGGELSPEDLRGANNDIRALYSSRGMAAGMPAIGAELLNREALRRIRMGEARGFAGQVEGMNAAQGDLAGRIAQIAGTQLNDPWLSILGRSSGAGGSGGGGVTPTVGTGGTNFDPLNPYAQDLFNTNFNAANSNAIAQANSDSAANAATIGLTGSLVAAALPLIFASDNKVKKNIRKVGETGIEGVPEIEFEYKGSKRRMRGVSAQDVEKIAPWAIVEIDGIKHVDFKAIDAPFYEVPKGKPKLDMVTGELKAA